MKAISPGTAEALIGGLLLRDFSHWESDINLWKEQEFHLGLGGGYATRAIIDPVSGDARLGLRRWGRDYSFLFRADSFRRSGDSIILDGCDGHVRIGLPEGFDVRGCAERTIEGGYAEGLVWRCEQGFIHTDIVDGKGEYLGSKEIDAPDGQCFDEDIVRRLIEAADLQRFSGLQESYTRAGGNAAGPCDLSFSGMEKAVYSRQITATAEGTDGPVSFRISGALTSGEGGIVFAGKRSWFELETMEAIPAYIDEEYLWEHPAPKWSIDRCIDGHLTSTRIDTRQNQINMELLISL